ncbi:MAG: hypothetical protein JNN07_06265 [Verrucomicrobiales bacterium]|nr:hypothetical protein [Verrucomicrobiales bacterium]
MAQALIRQAQRVSRPTRCRSWGVILLVLLAGITHTGAHRLDECLQAARIEVGIRQIRIELDLTPGAQVAHQIIRVLDADQNGQISPSESDAYADLVRSALELTLDARQQEIRIEHHRFPSIAELKEGTGIIQLQLVATHTPLRPKSHQLIFTNRNAEDISVYLANALVPSETGIRVTQQERDSLQRVLKIHFSVDPSPSFRFHPIPRLLPR